MIHPINALLASVNVRGKGRILTLLRRLFLPKEQVVRIRRFPSPDARFRLSHRFASESNLMLYPFPENLREELLFLKEHAKRAGAIFDVGANIGLFTVFFAREVLSPGSVAYAFEPVQELFVRLAENVRLNGLAQSVRVESLALHTETGTGTILIPRLLSELSGAASFREDAVKETIPAAVPTTTIDAYVREHHIDPVALIKIDTEGNEDNILREARETIARDHPFLHFEVLAENFGGSFEAAREMFEKLLAHLGYTIFFEDHLRKIPIREALQARIVRSGNWWAEAKAR